MSFKSSSLSVIALALAAPVLFHYGPSFIKQHESKVLDLGSVATATTATTATTGASWGSSANEPATTSDAVKANLEVVKENAAPVKPKAMVKKKISRKQSALSPGRRVNSLSGQPLPEAPALKPAAKDNDAATEKKSPAMSAQERKFMGKDRNFSDPMKDRWVNDVSGQNARVSFEKFRHADNCQLAGTCERAPAPNDLSLAGVVVDSDQLRRPAGSMLDGNLKRGHYVNKTPAVYLK